MCKGTDFQNYIFINKLGKFFQIVIMWSWIILLNKAAVDKKKYQNFAGNPPPQKKKKKHKCIRAIAIMIFTLSNRITLFIVKLVAGMATPSGNKVSLKCCL